MRRKRSKVDGVGALVVFLGFMLPIQDAWPGQRQQWLAGAEGSADVRYAYIALVMPVGESQLGRGLVQRYWLDRLQYRYRKGSIGFKATAPGFEGALGYQQSASQGWWGVYTGLLYRDTAISPDDPESRSNGGKLRLRLQLEGERLLTPAWRLNGNGSYVAGQHAYWIRTRLLYGTRVRLGPELTFHGDRDYRVTQIGAVINGFSPQPNSDLGIKFGIRTLRGESSKPYIGVEYSRVF